MRKLATPLSAALAISFVAIFLAALGVLQMGAVPPVRGADQVPDPVSAYQDVLTKGRNLVPPITEPKPVLTSAPTPTTELTTVPHITLSAAANPRPALISAEAILTVRSRTAPPGANVAVPIWLENAGDMVRLEFNLNYDPLIAEVVDVRHGSRTSNTAFSYNAEIPGFIRFGTAAARAVSGDGSAAVVKFKIIGPRGSSSSMTLTNSVVGDDQGKAEILHL